MLVIIDYSGIIPCFEHGFTTNLKEIWMISPCEKLTKIKEFCVNDEFISVMSCIRVIC